jgi:NAD(P)-dependent dehydrogenase (short-subunit alcohol dehydrogenase family)
MHGPVYGAVKAGVDKLSHDMAVDFRPYQVTAVSLWLGLQRTERTQARMAEHPERFEYSGRLSESPEFTGRVIAALDRQPDKLDYSGRVFIGAELGESLGVTDIDGTQPRSRRALLGEPSAFNDAVVQ